MRAKKVVIVGSGVSGLSTAYHLLLAGYSNLTILSKEAQPHTSSNAYALWVPNRIESDPRVQVWAQKSYGVYAAIAQDVTSGVEMRPMLHLLPYKENPWFSDITPGFRHATAKELPAGYVDGHYIESIPVIDPPVYLQWLRNEVAQLGALFQTGEVNNLADLQADIVVNCTALGSRTLVGDTKLTVTRLQVVRMKQNGFEQVVYDNYGPNAIACVVPHRDYIKLGGHWDDQAESLEVDSSKTLPILERCSRITGVTFKVNDILNVVRCVRPTLASPRVEAERLGDTLVVHNYGHEARGYLAAHGCAQEVFQLIKNN